MTADTNADKAAFFSIRDEKEPPSWKVPHAFHQNLPPHHFDPEDGVPFITKYAYKKSRYVLRLLESLQITENMLLDNNEAEPQGEDRLDSEEDMMIAEDDDAVYRRWP